MHIIDCKAIKNRILSDVHPEMFARKSLLALMKENNAANRSYLKAIEKMAKSFGLSMEIRCPDPSCPMDDIRSWLRARPNGTAVLFAGYSRDEVVGIHRVCSRELMGKKIADNGKRSDVVRAIMEVLFDVDMFVHPPKRTVIIGRSRNGRNLCSALLDVGHTVTVVHTRTADMDSTLREADLIVSFAGCPKLIKSHMVKDGATVISVGCGTLNGKLCGDIDIDSLADRDVTVTPTPGGVGPICTAVMLRDIARWEVKYRDN